MSYFPHDLYDGVNFNLSPAACYREGQTQQSPSANSDAVSVSSHEEGVQLPPLPLTSTSHPSPTDSTSTSQSFYAVADKASQLQDEFVRVLRNTKLEFSKKPADFLAELRITLTTLPMSDKFKH